MDNEDSAEDSTADHSTVDPGPQATGTDTIRLDYEYRLSPLVQIPLVGTRVFSCSILIALVVVFGLGIPETLLNQYFYQPSIVWVVGIVFVLWPLLAYRFWGYQLRQYDIIVKSGVLFQRQISIPWSRIQQVDSRANPLDRLCGLKRLILHSAGSRAGRTSIPGIDVELTEALQNHLASIVEKFHGSKSERLAKFKEMMKARAQTQSESDGAN